MMTFMEAKEKLKEIAAGKYHSLKFELTEFHTGGLNTECSIYINGTDWFSGRTWEDAFARLEKGQNGTFMEEAAVMAPDQIKEEVPSEQ